MGKALKDKFKQIIMPVLGEKFYYYIKYQLRYVKWTLNKPSYPELPSKKINIHLGCGKLSHPDFINVDLSLFPHIHHLSDIENLKMFKDNYADLIYTCHCLEHIPHPDIVTVLEEWRRVLKPGGCLRISVPNFQTIVKIYNDTKDLNLLQGPLMGGHDSKLNIHCTVFDEKYMKEKLRESGFQSIRLWKHGEEGDYTSFDDWSGKYITIGDHEYPISLNIEAVK